jgi:hypothetical protein
MPRVGVLGDGVTGSAPGAGLGLFCLFCVCCFCLIGAVRIYNAAPHSFATSARFPPVLRYAILSCCLIVVTHSMYSLSLCVSR